MVLKGKTAFITGCNRGIGKAILTDFANEGAKVYAHARYPNSEFEAYCKKIANDCNTTIIPIYFDLLDSELMKQRVKEIISVDKSINILVNSAGVVNQVKNFNMTKISEMKAEFDVNFFAQLELTQLLSRVMIRNKCGCIIFISSCAGLDGNMGAIDYVSSKAAIIGATKRLAIEFGNYGIRVNSIAPSLTDTAMADNMSEKEKETVFNNQIIKRLAKPEEVAYASTFLASDKASFITGQILRVDGGVLK